MSLLPDSKLRESYMKLINSQERAFNKKINEKEFHEALNITGMHEIRYKGNTYEKLRRSHQSQQSRSKSPTKTLKSDDSVEIKSESHSPTK
jgi:hypothetical protein